MGDDTVTFEKGAFVAAMEALMNLPLIDSIFYRLNAQGLSDAEAAALGWAFNAALEKKDAVLAAAGMAPDLFGAEPEEEGEEPLPEPAPVRENAPAPAKGPAPKPQFK